MKMAGRKRPNSPAYRIRYEWSNRLEHGHPGPQGLQTEQCTQPARSIMPYSVLLVDDHKIMRDGIKTILERTPDFRIVGEAENGSDAVSLCRKLRPDLVLMDIGMPGLNGIEATAEVVRHCPTVKVTILSMYDDENSVVAA